MKKIGSENTRIFKNLNTFRNPGEISVTNKFRSDYSKFKLEKSWSKNKLYKQNISKVKMDKGDKIQNISKLDTSVVV